LPIGPNPAIATRRDAFAIGWLLFLFNDRSLDP
jgi:hypothetical protein